MFNSDLTAFSDDDAPLASQPGRSQGPATNGHVVTNGNGRPRVSDTDDEPMSEDDDIPLSQTTRTKPEPATPSLKRKVVQSEDTDSSDDDAPLASSQSSFAKARKSAAVPMPGAMKATTVSTKAVNGKKMKPAPSDSDSDSDDQPLGSQVASSSKSKKAPAKKKRKLKEESDEEEPKPKPSSAKRAPKRVKKEEVGSETETPKPARRGKVKSEGVDEKKVKAKKKKQGDEEDEEVYKWWEQDPDQTVEGDGTAKWTTLEHSGVIFPPPYEPLPDHVKMKYGGKPVDLPPASEEVAGFYAAMLETDHAKDKTFNKNFFDDWLKVLKKNPPLNGIKITDFHRCDFRPIFEYFESEKAKKKALTTAEKKELKKAKDEAEAKYTTCLLDGRKEKVGNFRVEPPGLFRGRGDHPKKGALKLRVHPEDITLNIGKDVPIPTPNVPGKWKDVIHDNTVTWLATWVENVNGNHKYVFLAAGSSLKGQSDMSKFEKARELKKHVDRVRQDYQADLTNKVMQLRQRATAMYFIDVLALRAGNEKGDDEADTVGCCSLRCEHVTLEPPNFVSFDFLGKDSIRYYNRVAVQEQVFKNIRLFKRDKEDADGLFDRVNSYMKGLSAKVFRTYNASITFQRQLDEGTPENGTVQEKLNHYNHANRMVAILCNHQRAVPKTHEQSMVKMKEKLRGFKYERRKLRHALFTADPSFKKKKLYAKDESDLDDDAIAEHEESMKAKDIERAEKKFAKENEKLKEEDKEPQKDSVLEERIKDIEDEYKRLKKERKSGKVTLKRERPVEKLEEAVQKLDEKMKTFKLQMVDREAGKEVALGTSKINYLDPRITAVWCKKHDVPIEKIFSKTLLTKFPWAMESQEAWDNA
ncbi:hypothetical protein EWM64_g4425 [Hericium alpestre]|uniref:DNA topoisomerase I n=1 Tax=Hericium alpestre TaxID=135208 RepID=A0A4Z0A198_9AGAM|nr:hypothetical protein EWM64_g4425 [Hericium alpestre]